MTEDSPEVKCPPAVHDLECDAMSAFISESAPEQAPGGFPGPAGPAHDGPRENRQAGRCSPKPGPHGGHQAINNPLDDLPIAIRPPVPEVEPRHSVETLSTRTTTVAPAQTVWLMAIALLVGLGAGFAGGYFVARGAPTNVRAEPRQSTVPAPPAQTSTAGAPSVSAAGRDFTEDVVAQRPAMPDGNPADANRNAGAASRNSPVNREVNQGTILDSGGHGNAKRETLQVQPPVDQQGEIGRLLVRSTPDDAQVFVDQYERGRTPATIRGLSRGPHTVRVVRDGYVAIERTVTITPGQPALSLTLDLDASGPAAFEPVAPAPSASGTSASRGRGAPGADSSLEGALDVESRPTGAEVYLDGARLGTTPFVLTNVGAGVHALSLERSGYRGWRSSVLIIRGERSRITASLEER